MTTVDASASAPPRTYPLTPQVTRFLAVTFQLALILLAVQKFNLEPHLPFLAVMRLAAGGFVVHAWLPPRFRLAFFSLLSMASVVFLLGWTAGGCVLGIGCGLLVVCYLPLPMILRVLVIVVAVVALALYRIDSDASFWPILGSMFMFRLIVFLFDIHHERRRPPLFHSLAYFFALPNLCFTLFPVIDFKTFRETYYDEEAYTIYQTGIAWIVRGLTHLLVFRFVKYYLLPQPHEMRDLPHLLLFLATNYALYLRVSGWFHIITGILHLFGFNLPRTHHNYFLASSLSDIWRRINIYWKDFMTKVFFYPAFFRLRRLGTRTAVAVAGMGVFLATWLLHSVQVFWLFGELPLNWHEAVLWLCAGVAVTLNLQLDLRRAATSSSSARGFQHTDPVWQESVAGAILTLKILGTFLLVSFFWACWTLENFPSYIYVLANSGTITVWDVLTLLGFVVAFVAVGVVVRLGRSWLARRGTFRLMNSFSISAMAQAVALLALVAVGSPKVSKALGPDHGGEVLATLRLESTTPVEAAVAVQGYYEKIADAPLQVTPLLGGRPKQHSRPTYTDFSRYVDEYLDRELIPDWSGEVEGRHFTINHLGMRDRSDLTREKPADACRMAVVGSSVVMGWGVEDDEPFPLLLEDRLNTGREDRLGRVQVLNFGTGASDVIQRRAMLDHKVFSFNPDAIFYVAHQDEYLAAAKHLTGLYYLPAPLRYPYLEDILREAGVTRQLPPGQAQIRLQLSGPEVLRKVYHDIVAECRRRGIVPVWVYIPMPGITEVSIKASEMANLAKEAGFVTIDLTKWDEDYLPEEVKVDRHHANVFGHQLIAKHLQAALRELPEALPKCARPR